MSYPQTRILTGDFVYSILAATGGKMFALEMEPTVFKTTEVPQQTLPHDPVVKYDVTGLNNRDYVQYQIMYNGKQMLWCAHDCLGNIILSGYGTAEQAMQALEAHLNRTYGFIDAPTNQITQ
jgi:hypothetical protein